MEKELKFGCEADEIVEMWGKEMKPRWFTSIIALGGSGNPAVTPTGQGECQGHETLEEAIICGETFRAEHIKLLEEGIAQALRVGRSLCALVDRPFRPQDFGHFAVVVMKQTVEIADVVAIVRGKGQGS